jgi:hypothetical protein
MLFVASWSKVNSLIETLRRKTIPDGSVVVAAVTGRLLVVSIVLFIELLSVSPQSFDKTNVDEAK